MKTNKFLLFALLPLTCFSVIEIFLLPFRAYSQEINNSKEKKENLDCYQKYQEYQEAQDYCHALANTKIATDEKIWRNLTPIVWYNGKLKWENYVDSRVLVTTWTRRYDRYEEGEETTAQKEIWVTVVPELQEFCQQYDTKKKGEGIPLPYRLNQVLGLAPETRKKYEERKLVEIWVKPKYLFKPTPYPEITDREAELDFFQSYSSILFISYKHKLWFRDQSRTNRNPWTKLGYTYDWGNEGDWKEIDPERPAYVGLSEFIIREDAPIKIHSINEAEEYCKKKHTVSS